MNFSPVLKFSLILIVGVVTVFVIDPLDPSTVSTPFLLGIVLMALSLRQSVSLVSSVSVLYSALTIYALVSFHLYHEHHGTVGPHPYFWLFQRMGLFLVLCGLAIYLAHYRTDAELILGRLRSILSKLPVPVILSDASGNIVYANDAVTPVLHYSASDITGKSYFNFFHMETMKGKSIRSYFELFETDTNGTCELEVGPFGSANKTNAHIICLGTGPNRVLITVLQDMEQTADKLRLP